MVRKRFFIGSNGILVALFLDICLLIIVLESKPFWIISRSR